MNQKMHKPDPNEDVVTAVTGMEALCAAVFGPIDKEVDLPRMPLDDLSDAQLRTLDTMVVAEAIQMATRAIRARRQVDFLRNMTDTDARKINTHLRDIDASFRVCD